MIKISDSQLKMALKLAIEQMLDEEIAEVEISAQPFIERDERRHNKNLRMLSKEKIGFCRPGWRVVLERVALVVLVSATVLFGVSMCIEPVRAAFWNEIVTWYEDYIGVLFITENDVPTRIETELVPSGLPEGWTMEKTFSDDTLVTYDIYGTHGEIILYSQSIQSDSDTWYNNDYIAMETIELKENLYGTILTYADGMIGIYWYDDYLFDMGSYGCTKEILLDIAEKTIK